MIDTVVKGMHVTAVRLDGRELTGMVEKVSHHPKGTLVVLSNISPEGYSHKSVYLEDCKWWVACKIVFGEPEVAARGSIYNPVCV